MRQALARDARTTAVARKPDSPGPRPANDDQLGRAEAIGNQAMLQMLQPQRRLIAVQPGSSAAEAMARQLVVRSTPRSDPEHPDVRVHDDARAHTAAALMGAHAFTLGRDIVLGAGLGSARDAVLAHERRHVYQVENVRRGAPRSSTRALEAEAHELDRAPVLGADPDEIHGLWWVVPVVVGGYILLDPDPANAPGPDDPVYPRKDPGQRVAEAVVYGLPAARLAKGSAGIGTMMLWGGGSATGVQAIEDIGAGEMSSANKYVGRGLGGAIGWGLPMGPIGAFSGGVRGLPLYRNFIGYGAATGFGLRASADIAAWNLSPWQDYALWTGAGAGAGALGATVVTGLDFVATTAVNRSNVAMSEAIPSTQSMTVQDLQQYFARRPDLGGRVGQSYLEARSMAYPANLVPRTGAVNVGGGMETPQYSNLNPIFGTSGPQSGIPNHVRASFEQIDQVFQPGTVQTIVSYKVPASMIDWPTAANGAARVMARGGTVQINVWSQSVEQTEQIMQSLRNAGFSNVRLGATLDTGRQTIFVPSQPTGSGVLISATR